MPRANLLLRAMSTKTNTGQARSTYPRWAGASQRPTPFAPKRDTPPLLPPPQRRCPNHLPIREMVPPPDGYSSSRHIIPAAYPRVFKESTGGLSRSSAPYTAHPARKGETPDERKKRNLDEAKACVRARLDASPSEDEGGMLWVAGERWIRDRKEGQEGGEGLTLVVSAANGFTKEVSSISLE
jgi:hypothetical protein